MNAIAPDLPVWAQWFAALAVPIAAVFGVLLGVPNFWLARRRRRDELFDKRFQLFEEILKLIENPERFEIGGVDYIRVNMTRPAYRAKFLFGPDIANHLRKVEEWIGEPRQKYSTEDIFQPFRRYLSVTSAAR